LHPSKVTERGRVNGRQMIWPDSGTREWRWISERFLSREGSGEADRRIPGAHEASGGREMSGPEREIGWQTKYAT
jgi:hypothetical protein